MFILVDCNNFFVSCERVFRPDLLKKPVAVLSNNDGCIIARSDEVKAIGIPMGAPKFKVAQLLERHHVHLFSSNYELYSDMSRRVSSALKTVSSKVEQYSIDESFLFSEQSGSEWLAYGETISTRVQQWTGIPVSIGIAPTKTLAKVANKYAKRQGAVCVLSMKNKDSLLGQFPVGDLWGIGRSYQKKLMQLGINTAMELCTMPDEWIKRTLTLYGLRLVYELRGISCFALAQKTAPQKTLVFSRSFSRRITEWCDLKEAVVHYVTCALEKLRMRDLKTRSLKIFLQTNRFSSSEYTIHKEIELPVYSNSTFYLVPQAVELLALIYRSGLTYVKCGVILDDLQSVGIKQEDFFVDNSCQDKEKSIMKVMDGLNQQMGKNTLFLAGSGIKRSWQMKADRLSPRYTSRWDEMLII